MFFLNFSHSFMSELISQPGYPKNHLRLKSSNFTGILQSWRPFCVNFFQVQCVLSNCRFKFSYFWKLFLIYTFKFFVFSIIYFLLQGIFVHFVPIYHSFSTPMELFLFHLAHLLHSYFVYIVLFYFAFISSMVFNFS